MSLYNYVYVLICTYTIKNGEYCLLNYVYTVIQYSLDYSVCMYLMILSDVIWMGYQIASNVSCNM